MIQKRISHTIGALVKNCQMSMLRSVRILRRLKASRPQRWFTTETSPTNLLLLEDIVTPDEEDAFISIATKVLARKKYEGNHWDDVIIKYKEVDFGHHLNRLDQTLPEVVLVNSAVTKVKSRIEEALKRSNMEFQSPHVIDLAPDGWIGPHVDSIKFSGDLVAGLSLGTERTMVMTKDRNDGAPLTENRVVEYDSLPERYEFPLKRRSLYIMTGLWRYNYSHEITRAIEPAASTSRRISIIFRNEKHHDLMMRPKTVSVGM